VGENNDDNILVWTPTYKYVAHKIREKKKLQFIIAPFIKREALKQLLDQCEDTSNLKVIVRWDKADIVSQVSDLEVYKDLKNQGIPLYRHSSIHLKMLVFDQNWAFHTSSNITKKGLGLADKPNIEVGVQIRLETNDWIQIQKLLASSIRIDEVLYERFVKYKADNKTKSDPLPPLQLDLGLEKDFSKLSLPATQSPNQLYEIYERPDKFKDEEDLYAAFVHDLVLYDVSNDVSREDFFQQLGKNFKAHLFVQKIVGLIKREGSARFGKVNEWITEHCSDNPTPYTWELKESTNKLYNWLDYFFDEIHWDRPNYSQVIYWNIGQDRKSS
jgi:PLD-like domain